ncbi:UNVERIFIED_CONTAM: MurR/RpiR family transcriptional regulator [Comamonas sp. A-3]|uniref:MurR/RpiR family transcriptional regulator n=1 Tax=Comamonas thiooxydans TaxID=363952 RepID=A0AA42Q2S7_9BURK|nr:MurR/RpiR family transcriptional regulator [Comamonas thiooxydans]MDH1335291.1 MurR/RpiR family transcriptional regulator [Comamonas thiooxydans]MDH1473384.1 MurR/RpiR family transcriptional regulator [Comamonas thiooxydans]MDH1741796.1 MurR/RpiR family transcriptional regulator [Comamonas thiooxydans]MDH1787621.1 MurR/RpiR family transcriptional regulator [Comamonas thiooxydans]
MTVKDELRGRFNSLSPALQRIAKYVLDHPNEVVTSSMRTVGISADARPATLVRFAQQLGFAGWPELKQAIAQEMGLGREAYGDRARSLLERASEQGLAGEIFQVHKANLEATERHSRSGLNDAAVLLEAAPNVHVAGFRACFPIAFSFVYVYRLFRNSVHLIDGQGGSLEMQTRSMTEEDALLVISFAPYSREVLQVVEAGKRAGCKVIAITDSDVSPLSLLADVTLLFSTQSPSFFPSITSGMALTESLLELLVSRAGKPVIDRIERAEAHLFESGAYVDAGGRSRGS